MYEKLLKTVTNLGSPKVLVISDFMLDVYVYGDALRISPEAPVPVLKVTKTEYLCGGAGSVAADIAALGAAPFCLGVIGDDRNSKILKEELREIGADITDDIELEKFGTATVTVEEIVNEIISQNRGKNGKVRSVNFLADELAWHRRQNETIVFTNGCFDVVHRGHIEFLKFCKSQGNIVIVGLNSDSSVKTIKGPDRPINNQYDRAAVLAALETVDYITVFDEPDPLNLIKKVKPDILVKGQDWAQKGVVGREFVEGYGGRVVLAPLVEGKSSTATIEKMKSLETKS